MGKLDNSVLRIVGIVLESYRSNLLQKVSSLEPDKRSKVVEILEYFFRDIVISGMKKSLDVQISDSRSIAETIGVIIRKHVSDELVSRYGIVDKSVNGSFFLEPYSYDSDAKFLVLVSQSEIEYQKIINKYVLQNSDRIAKTLVNLIQIPLESSKLTPEQQEVKNSILKEIGDNPVTKVVADLVKDNIRYALRSNIDTFTSTMNRKVYEYASDKVVEIVGSIFSKIFRKKSSDSSKLKIEQIISNSTEREEKINEYVSRILLSIFGMGDGLPTLGVAVNCAKSPLKCIGNTIAKTAMKGVIKGLIKSLKYFFTDYIKRNKLKTALLGSFVLLVLFNTFATIFKGIRFVFRVIKFIFTLPIRIFRKFFKKEENISNYITEDILYTKKKKKIYYDRMKKIIILSHLYEELT